ncbi:hypothetical protein ACFLXI_08140, partial [Chloroflexota bacterium]
EAYLSLKPTDRVIAENEMANARKYRRIAADYAQAQDLMQKKRYEQAIELLQAIIAQDPTYKSASKLLTESVRAHIPPPIFKRPILYFVMGLIVIVFAGIFFWPHFSPQHQDRLEYSISLKPFYRM